MKTVNRDTLLKSGDKFRFQGSEGPLYTLQKFPDFNLWMLISEHNSIWMGPMSEPFEAFGGWHESFEKVI